MNKLEFCPNIQGRSNEAVQFYYIYYNNSVKCNWLFIGLFYNIRLLIYQS